MEELLRGRAAFPGVELDEARFGAWLLARPGAVHVEDLYLACALAAGDRRALQLFETRLLSEVGAFIAQIDPSADFADEVRQLLRERLLVAAPGDEPRIADYRGQGALGGWLRVAAVRTALSLKRAAGRQDSLGDHPPPALDPEIDFLKARYRGELEAAFRATLEKLAGDERNVLRLHYLDGCNLDEIGAIYHVHRSTVARWLAESRRLLLEETRRRLGERLDLKEGEIDSLIDLVQSRLEVSLRGLLP